MKIKLRIIVLGLVSLFLASCSNDSAEQSTSEVPENNKTYKWIMVTTWPKNFPGVGMAPENFSKMVDEMSNGRLKIKVYGSGELVPAFGVFDAVSQGTYQAGH